MSKKESIEKRFEEILTPIAEKNGVRIYDVEYVKEAGDYYLRAYIDKDGGVNIGECEAVSRALSDVLDADDFVEDSYTLDVSSPGLGRTLKKDRHLQQSIGQAVEFKTYKPIDGQKEFEGVLKAFTADSLTIDMNGTEKQFTRADISLIKLALDF